MIFGRTMRNQIDRRLAWIALLAAISWAHSALAEEATVDWYDPTCRYFVMALPEGFGLFEWKSGTEVKSGDVLEGEILGGPELSVTNKTANGSANIIHWGDSAKREVLIRNTPRWCKGKKK
jgi:hypothetical protein